MSNLGLGARLRKLRIENDKNQHQIGEIVGVHESTISLWENDKREPDISQIAMLANYFGVSCDYLIFGYNNANYADEIEKHWPELAARLKKVNSKQANTLIKIIDAYTEEDGDE